MNANLLTEIDVSKRLRVSLACLRRWRLERRGPEYIKVGSLVRYDPDTLAAWLTSLPKGGLCPDRKPPGSEGGNGPASSRNTG